MAKTITKLVLLAALAATAGCAKKRPDVLPPAAGEAPAQTTPETTGPVGNAVVPGSAEDFRQTVRSDTVNFALDQYEVDATAGGILESQAAWLSRYPNVRVTIEGHADERGTREYNLALGDRRANAVATYLANRGIAATRITTISYGKERPLALGSDEASWAQNRRAVTVVVE